MYDELDISNLNIFTDRGDADYPLDLSNCHVINLDKSVDRLNWFRQTNNLSGINIKRFSAYDGSTLDRSRLVEIGLIKHSDGYTNGALGCALSHIQLWKLCVECDRTITIFEDDVVIHPNFVSASLSTANVLTGKWDLIAWGYNNNPQFMWIDFGTSWMKCIPYTKVYSGADIEAFRSSSITPGWVRARHFFGTQGYSITPNTARKLLRTLLPLDRRLITFPGADVRIYEEGIDCAMMGLYGEMRSFISVPSLVMHMDNFHSDRKALDLN